MHENRAGAADVPRSRAAEAVDDPHLTALLGAGLVAVSRRHGRRTPLPELVARGGHLSVPAARHLRR